MIKKRRTSYMQTKISKSRRSSFVEERRNSLVKIVSMIDSTLDGHALYKVKVDKTCKKLNYFFGETTPVDVCINEIHKEGLKAILESKVPLCYFLYHLLNEFSSENLFFFLDVSNFENQSTNQSKLAKEIIEKYISTNSNFEINLEDRVKRDITTQFSNSSIHPYLFNEAKISIYVLLESSFIRFLNTQAYKDMKKNCGLFTIHYNDQIKNLSLNYILRYLHTIVSTKNQSLISLNLQHYQLIKLQILDFIQSIFGLDYFCSTKNGLKKSKCTYINNH